MDYFSHKKSDNFDFIRISNGKTEFPDHHHIDDLPLIVVETSLCKAIVSLQGAQLLSFLDKNNNQCLWLSPNAVFKKNKAIRGGIPVCFPWFGPHPTDSDKPQHGFARITDWTLLKVEERESGDVLLEWGIQSSASTLELFPFQFEVKVIMQLGDSITFDLVVDNLDENEFPLTWAFHTYFPIATIEEARISGLSNTGYYDNACDLAFRINPGDIVFNGEVDKQFVNVNDEQEVLSNLTFSILGENCPSAIVWNPGLDKAAQMSDVGKDAVTNFVCLERGLIFDNKKYIYPGCTYRAKMVITANIDWLPNHSVPCLY